MGKWIAGSLNVFVFLFGLGVEISGVTSEIVGYGLMAAGGVGMAWSAYLLSREWLLKRSQDSKRVGVPTVESPQMRVPERDLTETERLHLRSAWGQMLWHHGHVDPTGLTDNLLNERPLNGPCWLCGKPRFQRGGDSGDVHKDDNG